MNTEELYHMLALIFCAGAAALDVRSARVDNLWILIGVGLSCLCQLMQPGEFRLTGLFIPLLFLFPLFIFRMIGAGDVKLLCILGMFMGPRKIWDGMLWTFVFAAVLSLAVMPDAGGAAARFRYFFTYMKWTAVGNGGMKLPERYIRSGMHAENIHLSVPALASVLLWYGGLY